jgi:two-component system sensor histidine kinase MprB
VSVRDGEVIVADQGPGIAEEDLPRIFDRFYRSATARSKPGAGLGLAIVREAAEAHGGKATAESSASGARFRISLPVAT